jgi:hypothetical protein
VVEVVEVVEVDEVEVDEVEVDEVELGGVVVVVDGMPVVDEVGGG